MKAFLIKTLESHWLHNLLDLSVIGLIVYFFYHSYTSADEIRKLQILYLLAILLSVHVLVLLARVAFRIKRKRIVSGFSNSVYLLIQIGFLFAVLFNIHLQRG